MKIRGKYKIVGIEEIIPNVYNPKDDVASGNNKVQYDYLGNSLKLHGIIDPILVREKDEMFEIVDGYHRYKMAKESGVTKLPIINLGIVSDFEAKQITIKKDKIKIDTNELKLADLIKEMKVSFDGSMLDFIANMPFSSEQMSEMIGDFDVDITTFDNNIVTNDKFAKDNLGHASSDPDILPRENISDRSDEKDESDIDRKLEVYLNNSIKQITLYFEQKVYNEVYSKLQKLYKELEVDNNSDLFLKLVEFYESNTDQSQ